jgi:hypothetical protein
MTTPASLPPMGGPLSPGVGAPTKPPAPTGLKILVWIGLGFLLVMIVLMGTCTYCVMSNPEARKIGALIGESVRMGLAATKAPGTDELRAAGCDEAMVMDMRDFMKAVSELDKNAEKSPSELDWQTMVICQVRLGSTKLSCENIARVYGKAVPGAPAKFAVGIQVSLPQQDICRGLYGPDGTKLGELQNVERHFGDSSPEDEGDGEDEDEGEGGLGIRGRPAGGEQVPEDEDSK